MKIQLELYRPPTARDAVQFTLNIPLEELRYFDPAVSGKFFSKDEQGLPGESVTENIARVWRIIGEDPPTVFTSIAARVTEARAEELSRYGAAVLVLDPARIGPDTCVVNGDFKNLGVRLQQGDDGLGIRTMKPGDPGLGSLLNQLARSARNRKREPNEPRLFGGYFEARVKRALVLNDVLEAYLPPGATAQARLLERLSST